MALLRPGGVEGESELKAAAAFAGYDADVDETMEESGRAQSGRIHELEVPVRSNIRASIPDSRLRLPRACIDAAHLRHLCFSSSRPALRWHARTRRIALLVTTPRMTATDAPLFLAIDAFVSSAFVRVRNRASYRACSRDRENVSDDTARGTTTRDAMPPRIP